MKNPYEVLGVSSSASMDEIKKAYRDKARLYSENQAKMDELNDAYDFIINNLGGNRTDGSYSENSYGSTASQTSEFGDIRAKLNSGRIDDAEMLLDGIPYQRRNAEWYYLKVRFSTAWAGLKVHLRVLKKRTSLNREMPNMRQHIISLSVNLRETSERTGRTSTVTAAAVRAIYAPHLCVPTVAASVWAAT